MENLKEIDEEILEGIKRIHELVTIWGRLTKQELDDGGINEGFFEETNRWRAELEIELRKIYKEVMEKEDIEDHIAKMNEKVKKMVGE